jgi:hypothetical protein
MIGGGLTSTLRPSQLNKALIATGVSGYAKAAYFRIFYTILRQASLIREKNVNQLDHL